jgi:hypothetical protein
VLARHSQKHTSLPVQVTQTHAKKKKNVAACSAGFLSNNILFELQYAPLPSFLYIKETSKANKNRCTHLEPMVQSTPSIMRRPKRLSASTLHSLSISASPRITRAGEEHLCRLMQKLVVAGTSPTTQASTHRAVVPLRNLHLQNIRLLPCLELGCSSITFATAAEAIIGSVFPKALPVSLERLEMFGSAALSSDMQFELLIPLHRLHTLALACGGGVVGGQAMERSLSMLFQLTTLEIHSGEALSTNAIEHIARGAPMLQVLRLARAPQLSGALFPLSGLSDLREIQLSCFGSFRQAEGDFLWVSSLANLETFALSRCQVVNGCDRLLDYLARLPCLTSLTISYCSRITTTISSASTMDTSLFGRKLLKLKQLKALDLSGCLTLSDSFFIPSVDVNSCGGPITPLDSVENSICQLRLLNMANTPHMSDKGFCYIVALFRSSLQTLILAYAPQLSDAGLDALRELKLASLSYLNVDHCSKLSEACAGRFLSSLPRSNVSSASS